MKSRIVLIVLAFALSAFILAGCTDKTDNNPTRPDVDQEGFGNWIISWQFFSIFFSTGQESDYLAMRAYTPPGYSISGGGEPYPVLYLLSPFRGDERYYFEHGLAQVADRLIAEGKIQPMIIVSVDGQSSLGGSFYTNSAFQGKYFSSFFEDAEYTVNPFIDPAGTFTGTYQSYRGEWTFRSDALIPRFDRTFYTIDNPGGRAVAGVGMGGYGAFRMALETDMFSSVSAVNAPLDFDGSGNGGFRTLLNEAWPGAWSRVDDPGTGVLDTVYLVDTSLANPALSLIVSAAGAFSPHYQNVNLITDSIDPTGWIDSVYVDEVDSILIWAYTPRTADSVLTTDLSTGYLPQHGVHVPYDTATGMISEFVWNHWMENNIQNLYQADANGYASNFDDMKKLLVKSRNSADAEFHYGDQMDAFIDFLNANGDTNYSVMDFVGSDNLPGTADHFLYDLLEDILIFHSDNFDIPEKK